MKTIAFTVDLLEDISLPAGTSRGQNGLLDFIPGRVFLGLVANQYDLFKNQGLDWDVFFSGKVRFLDARINDQAQAVSIPLPLSLHTPKRQDLSSFVQLEQGHQQIANYLKLTKAERDPRQSLIQRVLFERQMTSNGEFVKAVQGYALKTSINERTGTSAEGKLFGIAYMKAGISLTMRIEVDAHPKQDQIIETISQCIQTNQGLHRIGQSKNAEFGLIKMKIKDFGLFKLDYEWQKMPKGLRLSNQMTRKENQWVEISSSQIEAIEERDFTHPEHHDWYQLSYLLLSDTCLIDEHTAQPSFQPTPKDFGLTEAFCSYLDDCFVRKVSWNLYQQYYQRPDLERIAFKAGSVVTFFALKKDVPDLKNVLTASLEKISHGIGSWRSEGLGQVVFAHPLIQFKEIKTADDLNANFPMLQKRVGTKTSSVQSQVSQAMPKDMLGTWLKERRQSQSIEDHTQKIANLLFESQFKRFAKNTGTLPKSSQWSIVAQEAKRFSSQKNGYQQLRLYLVGDGSSQTLVDESKKPLLIRGVSKRQWLIEDTAFSYQTCCTESSKPGYAIAKLLMQDHLPTLENDFKEEFSAIRGIFELSAQEAFKSVHLDKIIPTLISLLAKKVADHIKFQK
jgi:hypothetical protein